MPETATKMMSSMVDMGDDNDISEHEDDDGGMKKAITVSTGNSATARESVRRDICG